MESHSAGNAEKTCKAFASIDVRQLIVVTEGILTGGGGGFTLLFSDFIVDQMGKTLLHHYTLDLGTGQPVNIQTAPLLLNNRADEYARLKQMAQDINFFKIELDPPLSSIVRHTAMAHPNYGLHCITWAMDASPTPPEALVKFDQEIRSFLTAAFNEEYGR